MYSHIRPRLSRRAELCEICGLFAVMVHMHAQARRVAHALLADLALEGSLPRVMLIADVDLQIVPVREESMAGRTFHAACFAIPA